jgi:hypothetical protein
MDKLLENRHNNSEIMESVSMRFVPRLYNEASWTRVEAGSNTSNVTLRVVAGDKKGSLESETVKYS